MVLLQMKDPSGKPGLGILVCFNSDFQVKYSNQLLLMNAQSTEECSHLHTNPDYTSQSLSKQACQPLPEIMQLLYGKTNASFMVLPRILNQYYQLNNTAVFLISSLLHSSIQGSWGR